MSSTFVIAGTDTDVGKTVFAAALCGALCARYWKPIQCGLEGGGDVEIVRRLSGLPPERVLPEVYRLATPASPHRAAEIDGIEIEIERLAVVPVGTGQPLVIEGAGGLMVPLTRTTLQIDLFARWMLPVILCARTALGTINHTLLSIEALNRRRISIHGIAVIGEENADSERTICDMGVVRRLGRLPFVSPLDRSTLAAAFAAQFSREDFSP
ncbi:MAG: dethiobiotin synthase [Hyphomicrobium sp.]